MNPGRSSTVLRLAALLTLLSGCQQPASEPTATPTPPGNLPTQANTTSDPTKKNDLSEGAEGMEKSCEGTTFRIVSMPGASPGAAATLLERVTPTGAQQIEKPGEMAEYTAVGLGCAVSASDKQPYFVVQYGELPYGCSFCEWFYLYDANGKQLTTSNPPVLIDASLPPSEQQTPNTREYEERLQTLGLTHPELEYIETK